MGVFYVYIIRCLDGSFYTGFTKNISTRIHQHKAKRGAKWTKDHGVQNYTYMTFSTVHEGRIMELKIKKYSHARKKTFFQTYGTFT